MNFKMSTITMEALNKYRGLRNEFDSYFSFDEDFSVSDDVLLYTALSKEIEYLEELLADKDILEEIKARRRV